MNDRLAEEHACVMPGSLRDQFAQLVDDLPGVIVWEAREHAEAWAYVYVNAAAEHVSGYTALAWMSDPGLWRRAVDPRDSPRVEEARRAAALAGGDYTVDYRWHTPCGGVLWLRESARASEQEGGAVLRGLVLDVTEQRRAADSRRFLIEASALLATSLDYRTTLPNVARLAVPELADWCSISVLEPDGRLRNLAVAHAEPARRKVVRGLRRWLSASPDAPAGPAWVVRTGRSELVTELPKHPVGADCDDPGGVNPVRELGIEGYICVPMAARGRVVGAITLLTAGSARRYTPEDLALAEDLGRRAAMAVDNARLYHEAREEIAERRHAEAAQATLMRQVQTHRRWLDDILASIPGIVWEITGAPDRPDHQVGFVSDYAEQMLGYPVSDWLERPAFWLAIMHPDDRERAARQMAERFAGRVKGGFEFRWVRRDGSAIWVESRTSIVYDDAGAPAGMRGVAIDITARMDADERLRQRAVELARMTRALERSNRELDQFAYAASHDLKAPLRGIANLSHWIEEDLQEHLTDGTRRHLELLRSRVARMEAMIEGILQYARVGRLPLAYEPVDVGRLLEEVVDLLAPPQGFVIDVPPGMPVVLAKRLRLQQVFMNLVGNAVKHHNRPDGRVSVRAADHGDMWEFAVSDDGPGIRPEYHERVFGLFQALAPHDHAETAGVGLALVQKIVENEGGAITLESDEGAGTTFRFTWRKEPKKEGGP